MVDHTRLPRREAPLHGVSPEASGDVIDLLIPVLGRPQNAQPLVESIHAATSVPHTILFVCSRGDDAQIEACKTTNSVVLLIDGGDFEYARKINHAAVYPLRKKAHEFVFLGADDIHFHDGWDLAALEVHENTGKPVIGTNDLGNPTVMAGRHATHNLVHRSYIERGTIDEPGKLLHEGYHHNYCDTEFIDTARSRNAWVFAPGSHVEHLHYIWHKGKDDDIYAKGRAMYGPDGRTYRDRKRLWR